MRYLILLSLWLPAVVGSAQNLVPNGSFEEYETCPTYFGLADWCTGWHNLYTRSADYFNACHTSGVVGIPLNQFGYQYPADGFGYMGMATYSLGRPEYREMVGIQLTEPLQEGVPVCLSLKVAVGGYGTSGGNSAAYTCKGIGIRFFTTLPEEEYIYDYPNSAVVYLDMVPVDTAVWYQVNGTYLPDSAYNFLVIGNFFADTLNDPTLQDEGFAAEWAYAFVDDVRASFDLNYCTLTLGLEEERSLKPLVYPMPFTSTLHIRLPERPSGGVYYTLCDMTGRSVRSGVTRQLDWIDVITAEGLSSGSYVLRLFTISTTWAPIPVTHVSP